MKARQITYAVRQVRKVPGCRAASWLYNKDDEIDARYIFEKAKTTMMFDDTLADSTIILYQFGPGHVAKIIEEYIKE